MFAQILINSIVVGSIYALIAVGFNLIFKVSKFFNLSHGIFVVVGGYSVIFLLKFFGLSILWSIFIGLLFTGFFGWLAYKTIFEKLKRKKASNMVLLVASLGVNILIQTSIAMLFSSKFQTINYIIGQNKLVSIFGATITQIQIFSVLVSLFVIVLVLVVLRVTKFGKIIKAIGDNEEMAEVVGIETKKYVGYAFFVGSLLAGLAGVMIAFDTGLEPSQGFSYLLKGVVASLIGGTNNLLGALLGAYAIGILENFGIWYIDGIWKDTITYALLLFFLLIKPFKQMKK